MKGFKFQGQDCKDITFKEVETGINARNAISVQKMIQEFNKLRGSHVPRQCFVRLLTQCAQLYKFREVVKNFQELNVKEMESNGEEEDNAILDKMWEKIEEGTKGLGVSEKALFESLSESMRMKKELIQGLSRYAQKQDKEYHLQLMQKVQESGVLQPHAKIILESLHQFHIMKQTNQSLEALHKTIGMHEQVRKQNQDSIQEMKKQLEDIHQKYQAQFRTLLALCHQHHSHQIVAAKEEVDNADTYTTLHDFLEKSNDFFKNAKFYNNIVQEMKNFLQIATAPLRQDSSSLQKDISFIIVDQTDIKYELTRIFQAHQEALRTKIHQLQQEINRSKQQQSDKENILRDMETITKEKQALTLRILQLQKENMEYKNKVTTLTSQVNRLNEQLSKEKGQLSECKKKFDVSDEQRKKLNDELLKIRKDQQVEKLSIDRLRQNNSVLQRNKSILERQVSQLKNTNLEISNAFNQKQEQLHTKMLKINQQLAQQKQKKEQIQKDVKQRQNRPIIRPKHLSKVMAEEQPQQYQQIFSNLSMTLSDPSILYQLHQELYQRRKFTSAQLLYRFDSKNKTNIHEYIDGKPNILLVAKTPKRILGVFCSQPIVFKQKGVGADSFLFSFKDYNLSIYPLIEGKSAFQYGSKDYLIFGKSDLRIEPGSLKLSSNFGLESSHYQSNGGKINDFLQQGGKRDVTMVTYEIFQLFGGQEVDKKEMVREQGFGFERKEIVDSTIIMVEELELQKKVEELESALITKKKQLKQSHEKLDSVQKEIIELKEKYGKDIENLRNTHNKQTQNFLQKIKSLAQQVQSKTAELSNLQIQLQDAKQECSDLSTQISALQKIQQRLNTENKKLFQGSNQKLHDFDKQIMHAQEIIKGSKEREEIIKKLSEQQSQNRRIIQNLTQRLKESQLKYNTDIKNQQLEQLSKKYEQIVKTKVSLQKDLLQFKKKVADLTQYIEKLTAENLAMKKRLADTRNYDIYFPNQVLEDQLRNKQFFIKTLEDVEKMNIKKTRILFRFDPFNKTNFHRYIDGIPNIFLVIKLKNGRVLGCYSNCHFQTGCKGDNAVLMVGGLQSVYYLRQGMKAIAYDEYYLIFGNSEIRLKSGESVVFSNFGIANSHFQNNRSNVDALFGEGKQGKQVPIIGYEIYQLIFE